MGLYLVGSFNGANILTKLAFIFLLFAMIIGWIAYCTDNWGRTFPLDTTSVYRGYGIWRNGGNQDPNDLQQLGFQINDGWLLEWYGAFQALATFGFICLNVGFFLAVLFMFVAPCKSNADLSFWNAINNIFGSICWLVAIILFAVYFDEKFDNSFGNPPRIRERALHYSFGLAIFTFALQLAAGILLLLTKSGGGAVGSR